MRHPGTIFLIACLTAGCAAAPSTGVRTVAPLPEPKQVQTTVVAKPPASEPATPIRIVSKPAGASITLNDKQLGLTPGTFSVVRKPNRYGFLPRMTITATPPDGAKGLYAQTKVYDGYTDTPASIEFNMSAPPPVDRIEGN